MSVAVLSPADIKKLAAHGLNHIEYGSSCGSLNLSSVIEHSAVFAQQFTRDHRFAKSFRKEPKSVADQVKQCWFFMVHYAWIANRVAYMVQYQEGWEGGFEEFSPDEINPLPCTLEILHEELRHLRYNIYTNGGTSFMPAIWQELMEDILNAIALELVREVRRTYHVNQD